MRIQRALAARNEETKEAATRIGGVEILAEAAAREFFVGFVLPTGVGLSESKRAEYMNNASLLNAIRKAWDNHVAARAVVDKRPLSSVFWQSIAKDLSEVAKDWPHSLPLNCRRLQNKYQKYAKEGYAGLVEGRFGKRNAAKVMNEEQKAVLLSMIDYGNNYDNVRIADSYNDTAQKHGWPTISPSTVRGWKVKHKTECAIAQHGVAEFRNTLAMQVKRERPKYPLAYLTVDGWTVELLYQKTKENKKGHGVTTFHNRKTVVFVLDPCVNYILGYAIGDRENPALIRGALMDAVNHTRELFGTRYSAWQIQSDKYGNGNLTPAYQALGAAYTPAQAHNAKAKVIEPFFRHLNNVSST